MIKLNVINGSDLTEYVVQLLQNHGIATIREFLDSEENKLCKITNLTKTAIAKIRQELLRRHGPEPILMSHLHLKAQSELPVIFQTGIRSLDAILQDKAIFRGCLMEICGFSGIGKTQLCITTAVNFATTYDYQILYIETKADFIGTRIYQMLKSRNLTKSEMGQIMHQIKFQRVFSAESLIDVLERFLEHRKKNFSGVNTIKLIIIDSLPSLWFHMLGDHKRIKNKYLLTRLANLMRKLSTEYLIAFQFVNLLIIGNGNSSDERTYQCEDENDDDEQEFVDSNADAVSKPLLGRYWLSVPTIRLAVEKSNEVPVSEENSTIRVVRVFKSCYTSTGDSCFVHITNAGVV